MILVIKIFDISNKDIRLKKKEEIVIEFKYIVSLIAMLNEYKILGEKKYVSIVNKEQLLLRLMNRWKSI